MATATALEDIEQGARAVRALIRYVDEGDFLTRRYVSRGKEMNTGTYSDHEVLVRDGMPIRDHFTLDVHGFQIVSQPSSVTDFYDKAQVDDRYESEVEGYVKEVTGASRVICRGWMIRTSADLSKQAQKGVRGYKHTGGIQPPAGEAHVDVNTATARRMASATYAQLFPDGPGYKRFLVGSHWRTFSPPPQDVPLAVCDGRTSYGGSEKSNTMFIVDETPTPDQAQRAADGEKDMFAATIFSHHPDHRWWYFANMTRDDALIFKFHDSDHTRTWRCPHTAFRDEAMAGAHIRESIEARWVAFWE